MTKHVVLVRSNPVDPDPPVEKMADSLLELGYDITIACWDRNSSQQCVKELQLKNGTCIVVRFGIKADFGSGIKRNLVPLIRFQLQLLRWLCENKSKIDILHSFDFDTGFITSQFAKRNRKKLVYHILDYYIDAHSFGNVIIKKTIKHFEDRVINNADATIICTEKRKQQISDAVPKRLYIIHNTPDNQVPTAKEPVIQSYQSARMRIVYVGILAGSRMLTEIADIISREPGMEFHVGGFGKLEEQMKSYASKYENIYFYGKLPYEKTLKLESEGDVMVAIYSPTIRNNQFAAPNKFYESLMIGKPIIMAKGTGFDDIILENGIGVLADFSTDGIKKALSKLMEERVIWEDIGLRAKSLYQRDYSWRIMKDRIKELYREL